MITSIYVQHVEIVNITSPPGLTPRRRIIFTSFTDKRLTMSSSCSSGLLEQDPVFKVIQEMEKFRLKIHCLVYHFSILNYCITSLKGMQKCEQTLIESGFSPILSDDDKNDVSLGLRASEEGMSQLAGQLDYCRRLGLGDYLDLEKRATDVELTIKSEDPRVMNSYFDLSSASGPAVLDHLVKCLRLLEKREKIFPAWESLESKRVAGLPEKYDELSIIDGRSSKSHIFQFVMAFPANINFIKFNHVCDKYSFYCRYLDDELRNMYTFIIERTSIHPDTRKLKYVAEHFALADDVQLCENLKNKLLWDEGHHLDHDMCEFMERNSFRLYRACLNRGEIQLADEWMQVGLNITATEKTIIGNLVERTLRGLLRSERDSRKPIVRAELNGHHIGISKNYRPPRQRRNRPTTPSPKLWWTRRLRTQPALEVKMKTAANCRETCSSQATTVPPPETLTRDSWSDEERSEVFRRENLELNLAAAAFYRDYSRVSSVDMSRELPLCSIQIEMDQTECLYLKWKNSDGEDQGRRTNMQIGKPYHCRTFSYDAVNDEWVGNDTFCKFNSQLDVKQEGGSRVPILGDGGGIYPMKSKVAQSLFKMYRDAGDHRLDKYLADVRAQSVAVYYAERFREHTDGKFGYLTMLHVELVLIYDSFERGTIIDIATREILVATHRFGPVCPFGKFTNNWSWKNRDMKLDIFEAFSHFTYDDSDGVIMVADLQGFAGLKMGTIVYGLTDPVIHSQVRDTQTFGRTNYGTEGMNQFFANVHKECNHICEFLKLKRPDESGVETP